MAAGTGGMKTTTVTACGVSGFFCVSKRRVAWRGSQRHGLGGISHRPQAAGGDVRAGLTSQGLCVQPGGSGTGHGRTRIREHWLSAGTPSSSPHWLPEEQGESLPSTAAHRSGEQEPVGRLLPKALHKLLSRSR